MAIYVVKQACGNDIMRGHAWISMSTYNGIMGSEVFFFSRIQIYSNYLQYSLHFTLCKNIARCFKVKQVNSSAEMSCTFLETFQNWVKLYTLHMMLTTVASATASVSNKLGLMLTWWIHCIQVMKFLFYYLDNIWSMDIEGSQIWFKNE